MRKEYYKIIYAVYKIANDNNVSLCRKIFFETFSENIDILYDNIQDRMNNYNDNDNLNTAKVNNF